MNALKWLKAGRRPLFFTGVAVGLVLMSALAWCAGWIGNNRTCSEGPVPLPSATTRMVHSVIPDEWVTHNGKRATMSGHSTDMLILPSLPGPPVPVQGASYGPADLLTPDNAIKDGDAYCLQSGCSCVNADHPRIKLLRAATNSADLKLDVNQQGVERLRRLDWDAFRFEQAVFERWLFAESRPCIANPFRPARSRFTPAYEDALAAFWRKCLASAMFEGYAQKELLPNTKWSPGTAESTTKDYGPLMGAIVLEHGMRLAVKYGSTNSYIYGNTTDQIVRHTTTGTTCITVLRRDEAGIDKNGSPDRRLTLDTIGLLNPRTNRENAPKDDAWTISSDAPPPMPSNGRDSWKIYLPFGIGPRVDEEQFISVYHDLDWLHKGGLRALRAGVPRVAPYLTLLTPATYIQPDHNLNPSRQVPPTTTDGSDASPGNLSIGLSRRYMLWGSNSPFKSPDESAPRLRSTEPPDAKDYTEWQYAPLVFANQTSVLVEIPVTLNDSPAEFVPIGTAWSDLFDLHCRWVFTNVPQWSRPPVVTLVRTTTDSVGLFSTHTIRFFGLPSRTLQSVEVRPGDALYYSRGHDDP